MIDALIRASLRSRGLVILAMIVAYFFTRPAVILLSRSKRYARKKRILGVDIGEAALDKKVLVGAGSS